jgi:AcrR family transcriptional regulator
MGSEWGRNDQSDLAVEKILEAAEKAFVELGVSAAGMAEIANIAGCSRGTLYRYFKNRHELHLAYVKHTSCAIQRVAKERTESIDDPQERLVEFILCTIQQVRRNPATAAWFATGTSGLAARMSRSSEIAETLTSAFLPEALSSPEEDAERLLRQRWLVRVVVSLLTEPGGSEDDERELLLKFVAPVTLGERPGQSPS